MPHPMIDHSKLEPIVVPISLRSNGNSGNNSQKNSERDKKNRSKTPHAITGSLTDGGDLLSNPAYLLAMAGPGRTLPPVTSNQSNLQLIPTAQYKYSFPNG